MKEANATAEASSTTIGALKTTDDPMQPYNTLRDVHAPKPRPIAVRRFHSTCFTEPQAGLEIEQPRQFLGVRLPPLRRTSREKRKPTPPCPFLL